MSDDRSDQASDEVAPPASSRWKGGLARRIGYGVLVLLALVDATALAAVGLGTLNRGKEIASLQATSPPGSLPSSLGPGGSPLSTPSRACDRPTLIGTVAVDQVAARTEPDPN